jgi:hypothetical protein
MISRGHGRNHPLLEGVKFGIAIILQNALEGRVKQSSKSRRFPRLSRTARAG